MSSVRFFNAKLRLTAPAEALDLTNPALLISTIAKDVRRHVYEGRRRDKAARIKAVS